MPNEIDKSHPVRVQHELMEELRALCFDEYGFRPKQQDALNMALRNEIDRRKQLARERKRKAG